MKRFIFSLLAVATLAHAETTVTMTGVHNCCKKCADAAIAAVKNVSGITKHDIVAKSESFIAEGKFTKAELAVALNAEGLAGDIR